MIILISLATRTEKKGTHLFRVVRIEALEVALVDEVDERDPCVGSGEVDESIVSGGG